MSSPTSDFPPPTQEAPTILPPSADSLFAARAVRFAALAENHSLGEWLRFLGCLSEAQHALLHALPPVPLPDDAALERAVAHGMPPLNPAAPPPEWRAVARQLAARLIDAAPPTGRAALEALTSADDAKLDRLAARLMRWLDGETVDDDLAPLPFIAAALQVVFTAQAARLDARRLRPLDARGLCPCCGSPPVASLLRPGNPINNLRYLHCALCNGEWKLTRATCSACGAEEGVALREVEGGKGVVRAETCERCRAYLKIVYPEKDPHVDPVADDLATLALDLLVDEAGYARSGPNLLLIGAHG